MRVENAEGKIIVPACEAADNAWKRLRGLLGKDSLAVGTGMWFEPCTSIHTLFMRFAIDAVFISGKGKVLKIYHRMKPWRHSWFHLGTWAVLELAAGEAERLGIREGETLRLCKEG